jgi:hypothetical protein
MFFCEECRVKNDYPTSLGYPYMGTSYGKCELCGKIRVCHDVPTQALSTKTNKPKE